MRDKRKASPNTVRTSDSSETDLDWTKGAKQLSTRKMKQKRRADDYPIITVRVDI